MYTTEYMCPWYLYPRYKYRTGITLEDKQSIGHKYRLSSLCVLMPNTERTIWYKFSTSPQGYWRKNRKYLISLWAR